MLCELREIQTGLNDIGALLREGQKLTQGHILSKEVEDVEKALERDVKLFFRKHGDWIIDALKQYKGDMFPEAETHLFDAAFEQIEAKAIRELYRAIFRHSRKLLVMGEKHEEEMLKIDLYHEASIERDFKKFGVAISLQLRHKMAEAKLSQHVLERATSTVTKTMKNRISPILQKGVEQGWSYDRTAREIKKLHTYFQHGEPQKHIQSHAHLIAVTENRFAYELGRKGTVDEVGEVLGLRFEKKWNDSLDDRVCDICDANTDAGWISKEDTFPSGDETSPAHPACRCYVDYRPIEVETENIQV